MAAVDALLIGHFAKDRLVVDGRAEAASGGAVYYGGVALRRLGLRVGVVTRLHPDDFPLLDEVRGEGIEIFAARAEETTGIENVYRSADMERRVCTPLGFAGPFTAEDIPDVAATAILVVPIIAGEVDLPLLARLARRGPLGMDVQGFVRVREAGQLVFRNPPELRQGLAHVTYLKADRAEAELLTGEKDLQAAAKTLAGWGPKEIVLTQASGVTVYAGGRMFTAPFTSRTLVGRTGRGDTCFATYVGKRITTSPGEACRWAAAVTSLKQERPGPWRGTLHEVHAWLATHPAT
jgi:sugar/nucleoside kinase (ribokinase family)